jgi:hypothetical protein
MLPFRHVGGHNPGERLCLIDVVDDIAMTLMATNPPMILKQIKIETTFAR